MKILVTGGSGFIGTNLISFLTEKGHSVKNIDINPPRDKRLLESWSKIDICDRELLVPEVKNYNPDYIIHLAARTDLYEKVNIEGYAANMKGVANIMEAAAQLPALKRIVVASSMLVCKLGYKPKDYLDYCPSTLYGESKVETERVVRKSAIDWVLIRPTSIWGPWFGEPYRNFFDMVIAGTYVSLKKEYASTKTYGFVKNAVFQIYAIMLSENETVKHGTFYIGDPTPINVTEWATLIRKQIGKKDVMTINKQLLAVIAKFGDLLIKLGIKSPINSFRLKNMTTNNIIEDISKTMLVTGSLPFSNISDCTQETLNWLNKNSK